MIRTLRQRSAVHAAGTILTIAARTSSALAERLRLVALLAQNDIVWKAAVVF
jgi:hypothetical protein